MDQVLEPIKEAEVIERLRRIQTKTAAGLDNVKKEYLRSEGAVRLMTKIYRYRLVRGRNGAVRIMAKSSEIEKIKTMPALKEAGLNIKQFEKLNPRLIVRGVPVDIDRGSFVRNLVRQNLADAKEDDIKLVYWFPVGERRTSSVVVEVPPHIRSCLLSQGRVYINWSSCSIADHVRVTQCFKCLAIGHISKNCRADRDTCGHCSGGHESRACTNKGVLRCHNCTVAKISNTDHSAFDSRNCPLLQRRLSEKSRQIRY